MENRKFIIMAVNKNTVKRTSSTLVTIASITLLVACSSGSSSDPETDANTNALTNPIVDMADSTGGVGSELVGTWTACNEAGGLRFDYTFTNTTYTNIVGTGTCAGFDGAQITSGGTYSIAGTALSDTGLDSLELDLMQDSLDGFPLSESLRQTRYYLAYTGMAGQLFLSTSSFDEEDRSLELNFNLPFVRQ